LVGAPGLDRFANNICKRPRPRRASASGGRASTLVEVGDRMVEIIRSFAGFAACGIGESKFRIEPDRLIVVGDRPVVIALAEGWISLRTLCRGKKAHACSDRPLTAKNKSDKQSSDYGATPAQMIFLNRKRLCNCRAGADKHRYS
jgi:hypothetical protein